MSDEVNNEQLAPREATAVISEFNQDDELAVDASTVETLVEAFKLPVRNWNKIIEDFNASHKRKFPLTALQCKNLVEFSKKGIPAIHVFKTLGFSSSRYGSMRSRVVEIEDRMEQLATKDTLDEKEFEEFQNLLRHPLRILFSDIDRAEGAADIADWERFNNHAETLADFHLIKMKSKFKDFFGEKGNDTGGFNVQINLGGDFIKDI